jgi:adenylate kinase
MDRGDLVPDEVVVAIVSDRIDEPDAKRGFILDGFPRTVAQAEALEAMLAEKGLRLDGVIELKVDEDILIRRIESRIAETRARGEPLRKDDDPDVLKSRLEVYRRQTAPLIDYYREKGTLRAVDGMAPVDEVSAAINWIFQKPTNRDETSEKPAKARKTNKKPAETKARAKPAAKSRGKAPARKAKTGSRPRSGAKQAAKKAGGKSARKTARPAREVGKKANRGASRKSGRRY